MNVFTDPYEHLEKRDLVNTSIEVGKADQSYLYSIFPHRSVLQITMNILLHRFVQTLKQKGIEHGYAPDELRNAIATLDISITRGAGGAVANDVPAAERQDKPVETTDRNVGQGAGGVVSAGAGLPVAAQHDARPPQGGGSDKVKKTVGQKTKGA